MRLSRPTGRERNLRDSIVKQLNTVIASQRVAQMRNLLRRPGEGRDPYAVKLIGKVVPVAFLRRASQQRTFGVMGPGLRRDDA